jgi:PHD/YefM family antitoxin component YafN of YafNO toxin-antitoxin module
MTILTNPVAIRSKANMAARLTAIDVDSKTCIVNNGKEKAIKWSSAAEYKLDAGTEETRTLTPKLLTALRDAEAVNHVMEVDVEVEDGNAPIAVPMGEPQDIALDTASIAECPAPAATEMLESAVQSEVRRKRTPKVSLNDKERLFLSMIPAQPDFNGVESEMVGRALIKKALELHGLPINNGRSVFASLKNKG